MTSAAKHAYRSRYNHFDFHKIHKIKLSGPIIEIPEIESIVATVRRLNWYQKIIERIKKMVSGFRKQDRIS